MRGAVGNIWRRDKQIIHARENMPPNKQKKEIKKKSTSTLKGTLRCLVFMNQAEYPM